MKSQKRMENAVFVSVHRITSKPELETDGRGSYNDLAGQTEAGSALKIPAGEAEHSLMESAYFPFQG